MFEGVKTKAKAKAKCCLRLEGGEREVSGLSDAIQLAGGHRLKLQVMEGILLEEHCLVFFGTPAQKKHQSSSATCWRLWKTDKANHHHIFWGCPVIKPFWEQLCMHLNNIFAEKIPCKCEVLY